MAAERAVQLKEGNRLAKVAAATAVRPKAELAMSETDTDRSDPEPLGMAGGKRKRARAVHRSSDDEEGASYVPKSAARRARELEIEQFAVSIKSLSTADIGVYMLEAVMVIEKVARTSTNLKGAYVRMLRTTARRIEAGSVELDKRARSPEPAAIPIAAEIAEAALAKVRSKLKS